MTILHWLLWRVEANKSPLRMQLYGFWLPCSGPENTPNDELPEGHWRTLDTDEAQWNRSKWRVLKLFRWWGLWSYFRACQAGQSQQEFRTKSEANASWDDSPDCQTPALKPSPEFCVVDLSLTVEGDPNRQVSAVSSNGAEKLETHIGTLKPAFAGAAFPGKNVLPYTDDVMNDSSAITLSNEDLIGTTEVKTTKASSEGVDRRTP